MRSYQQILWLLDVAERNDWTGLHGKCKALIYDILHIQSTSEEAVDLNCWLLDKSKFGNGVSLRYEGQTHKKQTVHCALEVNVC